MVMKTAHRKTSTMMISQTSKTILKIMSSQMITTTITKMTTMTRIMMTKTMKIMMMTTMTTVSVTAAEGSLQDHRDADAEVLHPVADVAVVQVQGEAVHREEVAHREEE